MYPGKNVSDLNRRSYVTQEFYCTDTITINPYTGQLSGNILNFQSGTINTINATNITCSKNGTINTLYGNTAIFDSSVTCPTFKGTATSAIYDPKGCEVNTKTTLTNTNNNKDYNLIFS
jgi:hypothetical protein